MGAAGNRSSYSARGVGRNSIGAEYSLIAVTFVENQPVSFCYAGAVTESLWDVSIDTLPEHRRHGYAPFVPRT